MKNIAGAFLILLSLFMLLGFFKAELNVSPVVKLAALIIASGLPLVIGALLIRASYQEKSRLAASKRNLATQTEEAEILKLAEKLGGQLTVVELVAHLAMDQERAKALLELLAGKGLAEVGVTDQGAIVYTFFDIRQLKEKSTARNVLEV